MFYRTHQLLESGKRRKLTKTTGKWVEAKIVYKMTATTRTDRSDEVLTHTTGVPEQRLPVVEPLTGEKWPGCAESMSGSA